MNHNTAQHNTATLEVLLNDARKRIEVLRAELDEARSRRSLIVEALLDEFPGSRTYVNGSVAHGDALTPLTDVDLGVVIAEAVHTHGPGKRGPRELMDRAADAIRARLRPEFPHLEVVVEGRKRSVLVRFRNPVTAGADDFTADVIVAVDNLDARGLHIPRVPGWDRSHPEMHTVMIRDAIEDTKVSFARVVRLLKHWDRSNGMPLCSWNVKALALGCLTQPVTLVEGLRLWLDHTIRELAKGETPDPARAAPKPIRLNEPEDVVLGRLRKAAGHLSRAVTFQDADYPLLAHDELARMFNDPSMLPGPDPLAVEVEQARKVRADQAAAQKKFGAPALLTSVGAGVETSRRNVGSWAP